MNDRRPAPADHAEVRLKQRIDIRCGAALTLIAVLVAARPAMAGDLSVHGYLTQAYAVSDGPQFLGIPNGGTTDYRELALNLRYASTPRDEFTIQLNHARMGDSPFGPENDIALDYAFFLHRLGGAGDVRIGRTPLPQGVYNQVRAVGTVLPFYRVPYAVYREGSLTSEAVDGVMFSTTVPAWAGSRFEVDAFYGGWRTRERSGDDVVDSRIERAFGSQLWFETPGAGLRLGLQAQDAHVHAGSDASFVRGHVSTLLGSIDARAGAMHAETEYFKAFLGRTSYWGAFAHLGLGLTEALSAHVQVERGYVNLRIPTPVGELTAGREFNRDVALGLSYDFEYAMRIKAEYHRARSYDIDHDPPDFMSGDAARTRFLIVSVSASF